MLNNFPFSCRKAEGVDATLREIVMPCGGTGYVALCEIAPDAVVTVLAVRHHREDDYH